MTIFSLGSACDLEHFSSLNSSGGNLDNYSSPIVPMPTEPPNKEFGSSNYTWNSDTSAINSMTERNSNSFNAVSEGGNWGHVNFGPDNWGSSTETYTTTNPLLNDNNNLGMPNMKPQSAYMPTSRTQFVKKEDENGRKRRPKIIIKDQIVELPEYKKEQIHNEQKNIWIILIIALIIVLGAVLYKTKYI